MKKLGYAVLALLAGLLVLLGLSFRPATLPVIEDKPISLIETPKVTGVRLSVLPTGYMEALEAFAFRGGSFTAKREFVVGAVLVRHPEGNLLFDTGFGSEVDLHVQDMPWLMRATTSYTRGQTVLEQLSKAGMDKLEISRIVLTHAHWDHVSGLPDLSGLQILASHEETAFIESDHPAAALGKSFGFLPIGPYNYTSGPYLGFESSFDVFGDGSVVIVPAPGHTPGSSITFVHTEDGQHYVLIGDLVWQKEGVDLPAERPLMARLLVDHDAEAVRQQIVLMHRLQKMMPGLVVVPAHDRRVWDQLPQFPP